MEFTSTDHGSVASRRNGDGEPLNRLNVVVFCWFRLNYACSFQWSTLILCHAFDYSFSPAQSELFVFLVVR